MSGEELTEASLSGEYIMEVRRHLGEVGIEALFVDDVARLAAEEIRRLRREAECPICYGTPHASKLPCACGGSNKITAAFESLHSEWAAQSARIAALEKVTRNCRIALASLPKATALGEDIRDGHPYLLELLAEIDAALGEGK